MPSWDSTKPAASSAPASAEIRSQWQALEVHSPSNFARDPTLKVWAAGDSAAPTAFTLSGTGASVARCGIGLADTNTKVGKYCSKLTAGGGANGYLKQTVSGTSGFHSYLGTIKVIVGCWVKTSTISGARLLIEDGVGTTNSAYHTGGGSFEFLTAVRSIDASATQIKFGIENAASAVSYQSGWVFQFTPIKPTDFIFGRSAYETIQLNVAGTLSTGTGKAWFAPERPGIVKDVQLICGTAPTGQAIIVDVNTFDGSAQTSMFSTRPQIAASATKGGAQPDTTYARRCLAPYSGSGTVPAGGLLSVDIDQVGSGTAGSDLWVNIRRQVFYGAEDFLAYNE